MPEKFHIILEQPEMVNICFWYVPERLRDTAHGPGREAELGKVTPSSAAQGCLVFAGDGRAQDEDDVRGQPDDQLPAA